MATTTDERCWPEMLAARRRMKARIDAAFDAYDERRIDREALLDEVDEARADAYRDVMDAWDLAGRPPFRIGRYSREG